MLRAGRQTGKTTSARWLVKHENRGDRYRCLWVDVQNAAEQPDPSKAFRTILNDMVHALQIQLAALPLPDVEGLLKDPSSALVTYLRQLSAACPLPLIVLFDEADSLVGETAVLFLRQLRQGYIDRGDAPFPHSVVLIGMRDVRDYVLSQEERRAISWLGTASPFNITAEVTTLLPFTEPEVDKLSNEEVECQGKRIHLIGC